MIPFQVIGSRVKFGPYFSVGFQRTLRLPDDGSSYPLPPGLGVFPIFKVDDYRDRVPREWRDRGGLFIPMYQREALWLAFDAPAWRPSAVMVQLGGVNAVSGQVDSRRLSDNPQNYVVCPDQVWLDGINAGEAMIRQAVAMPLGQGYTVEAAITGAESKGGIQLRVYAAKPGLFPDNPPPAADVVRPMAFMKAPRGGAMMGLGAGGRMSQKIYPDEHGIDTWDAGNFGEIEVHILNSEWFEEITGQPPPPTPVDAAAYTEHGLSWFALYDESRADVAPPRELKNVKTIAQRDDERGESPGPASRLEIQDDQIRKIGRQKN